VSDSELRKKVESVVWQATSAEWTFGRLRSGIDTETATDQIMQLLAQAQKEAAIELASRIDGLADKYGLPSITTWKQGHFLDSPRYSHESDAWKAEQEARERTLIRPGGGTNNGLFQVSHSEDDALIVKYLENIGSYLAQLRPKESEKEADNADRNHIN
jgi:hypothetical protein